jgi:preprotein translocase subunit YajC
MTTTAMLSPAWLSSAWIAFAQEGTQAQPAPAGTPVAAPAATGQPISPLGGAPVATSGAPGVVTAAPVGGAQPMPTQGQTIMAFMMPLLLLAFVAMVFFSGRKEKKRKEQLMNSIKKGDRIFLNSGIMGTIEELHETEIVLRLEDGRMRVSKAAVGGVSS